MKHETNNAKIPAQAELDDDLTGELLKREEINRESRNAWQAGATALMETRDQRLYRAANYTDFGVYCREKLTMGKSTVNRQIAVAEVYGAVASTGAKILPASERQMRPLLRFRSEKDWAKTVVQVWTKSVQEAEITKRRLTQKSVERAIKQLAWFQRRLRSHLMLGNAVEMWRRGFDTSESFGPSSTFRTFVTA